MPTLYVLTGPELGKSFTVRAGDTIGRAPDRILTLRHASISRRHAHLEHAEGVWYVVDDGSQNGIQFEGQRMERAALHDAAEFRLGEVLLRFRLEGPPAAVDPTQARAADAGAALAPLEEEISLEGFDAAPVAPAPRGPAAPPAPREPTTSRSRPPSGPAAGAPERRVLQYHRVEPRAGLGDLSQHPAWVRVLAVLLGLALAGAAGWFAFRGASFVKQEVSRPASIPGAPEVP